MQRPIFGTLRQFGRGRISLRQNFTSYDFAFCFLVAEMRLGANKLAITVFDDYDDIVDKTCEAWNFFANDPSRIASITARPWATVSP